MLKAYLRKIFEVALREDAREESYYSTLEGLLQTFSNSINKKRIYITTLPKKTDAGNPDFRIWDGKQNIVGYIEAKRPIEKNLDIIEDTEQLKRYLKTFPNLILTNFFEFRLYRNGQLIDRVLIARPFIIHTLKTIPPVEKEKDFLGLLNKFFSFSLPQTYTAESLAIELAKRTRFLKDQVIIEELKEEEEKGKGFILGFYKAFQEYLIKGLTREDFADLYAQTITYGLFAARTRSQNGFNRKLAYDNIPGTIGILRDVFEFVSRGKLPPQMEWIIDDISEVLAVTDVKNILHQYFHEGKGKDPIVHFYETFLAEYDPQTREKRGVYYTPEPVVSYIARSLQDILKEHFNRADGFASDSVTVLDPAAGTLTFLAEASKLAVEEFVSKYGEGGKEKFIKEHILKNFYAFELMMAPYAVGHLKMSFLLEGLGYRLQRDDRVKLYLTNTLEMEELAQAEIPGMASLSEESHLAGKVKKEQPILVILGNPPYSGISANMGKWITGLIEDYKYVNGKHFGERKHWLQDDYVKFIRFGQWKIDQAGEGILGFITNHSYLDNPTFRGMRQSLMKSFNEIYILDLHGNSLKREKCPDGSKDNNVFDIQQGVSIALFIKSKPPIPPLEKGGKGGFDCKVHHSEIWGLREEKNDWLLRNDIKTTQWKKLSPNSPYYFFIPREEKWREVYEKYWKVTDIFPVNVTGIVTARDKFVIDHNKKSLEVKIRTFIDKKNTDNYIKEFLRGILRRKEVKDVENYAWRVSKARQELYRVENLKDYFTKILYRPFDIREIFFHDSVVWRTRKEVMQHMIQENLGLITTRFVFRKEYGFHHAFVTKDILDINQIQSPGTAQLFPLYLYPNTDKKGLFSHLESGEKKPNLNPELVEKLSQVYSQELSPEEIFFYIYGTLYSNVYRKKYAEFLKVDFPRIPFTKDYDLFIKMEKYGEVLVGLHLLKSIALDNPLAQFPERGSGRMENPKYSEKEKKVYINKDQCFEGIEKDVWEYQIGGYQVLNKWLKDRKGKTLSLNDIKHYCQIATALKRTMEIQEEIDNLYPEVEREVIE